MELRTYQYFTAEATFRQISKEKRNEQTSFKYIRSSLIFNNLSGLIDLLFGQHFIKIFIFFEIFLSKTCQIFNMPRKLEEKYPILIV